MKKIIFALTAMFGFAPWAMAQSSTLATLHHDGEIKTFYGANALVEANNVAADGDVITLSSGTFNAPADTITKAITLRGAGMELDTLNNVDPTIIQGNLVLNIPETATDNFILEAIDLTHYIWYCGTLKAPQFIKSRMNGVVQSKSDKNARVIDAKALHCIITYDFDLATNSSATLINCYVRDPNCIDAETSCFEMQNCVIECDYPGYIKTSIIKNSIIVHKYGGSTFGENYQLPSTTTAYNCVGVWEGSGGSSSTKGSLFKYQTNTTNTELSKQTAYTNIFKDYDFYNNSIKNFSTTRLELAESFKSLYKGSDGTELGIYGGTFPFDPISTNPRITKCEVAGKTTADGKLSVTVEVNGQK